MKVINYFGGPGAGKSTAASGLFYEMKKRWINAELVCEFAKELVWAKSQHMLSHQLYVFAEQEHRLNRLLNQVDVAVSDSPLLLSAFYAPDHYGLSFKQCVFDFFEQYDNINIFVRRSHAYAGEGRVQDEAEANELSDAMERFLQETGVPYYAITASDASPRYLLHWLVESGHLDLPDDVAPLSEDDRPPEGWLVPSLLLKTNADGSSVRTNESMAQSYIDRWVRKV